MRSKEELNELENVNKLIVFNLDNEKDNEIMKEIQKDEGTYSNKDSEILWLKQRLEYLETGKEMPIWQIARTKVSEVNGEYGWEDLLGGHQPYFPNEAFKYRIKPTEYTYYHVLMKDELTNGFYPFSSSDKTYLINLINFIKNIKGKYVSIGKIKEETVRCDI